MYIEKIKTKPKKRKNKRNDIESNGVKEAIGILHVQRIVEVLWRSGWQEFDAKNDDAIDGIILMRRGKDNPADTGGIVFTQVKCGSNGYLEIQKGLPDFVGVKLGIDYLESHKPRWAKTVGPCVLIFVDDTNIEKPEAWWVDLKNDNCYSKTNLGLILIPKNQKFTKHTKGDFHRLCGSGMHDRTLQTFNISKSDIVLPNLSNSNSFRKTAWSYYKDWRNNPQSCINPKLGEIYVNRVGWKHITRVNRLSERIVQSLMLLGSAKILITQSTDVYLLGNHSSRILDDGDSVVTDYIGLRGVFEFTHRESTVVQVVLKRSRLISAKNINFNSTKIWFYSVYELRRGNTKI